MAHLALYREFRPQRFADVVGQQHITRTLRNALMHRRLHHAYLLSGPRGTGKTTVARLLAKAVNCLDPRDGEPCNECTACQSILSGNTMDVIEIDAASNRGIDDIRDMREKVRSGTAELKYKVYIIDEVHMLSEPAFNALLKTLEEPPGHVLFILATTEKQKLPVTIVSRCQSFEYHRLAATEIMERLREVCGKYRLTVTEEALSAIARQAEGGMRDALSLLDQVMAYSDNGTITLDDTLHVLGSAPLEEFLKLDERLVTGDVGGALLHLNLLVRQGKDLRQFVRDYLAHMRDLLLLKVDVSGTSLDLPAASLEALKRQAGKVQQEQILAAIRLFAQVEADMRLTTSPRLLVEVGLIRLGGVYTGQMTEPARPEPVVARPGRAATAATATAAPAQPVPAPQPAADDKAAAPPPGAGAAGPAGPAARPADPPPPSGAGVERVVQVWDQVLDLVKKARPSTHTLLTSTRIARLRGKTVILVAPNSTLATLLKRADDKAILEKALAKVGLTDMDVHPVGPDDPAARPDPSDVTATTETSGASERSLLEIAQSVFPKELVHEVKEEGSR